MTTCNDQICIDEECEAQLYFSNLTPSHTFRFEIGSIPRNERAAEIESMFEIALRVIGKLNNTSVSRDSAWDFQPTLSSTWLLKGKVCNKS